jgi:SAM-dependent methyltransferase
MGFERKLKTGHGSCLRKPRARFSISLKPGARSARRKGIQMSGMDYKNYAERYDTYVKATFDVPFFLKETEGHRQVLELMSGTGRLSIPLLDAGVPLTCVDNSPDMLAVLRRKLQQKGVSIPVYEMDVRTLSLPQQYDFVLIPFHSFEELLSPDDQTQALLGIRRHLADGGTFICTLHNPPRRLKSADGALRLRGEYPLDPQTGPLWGLEKGGTVLLWGLEQHDRSSGTMKGVQQYEVYDESGVMRSKSFMDTQFVLHSRNGFEQLAQSAGFRKKALFGDYSRSVFERDKSPFMIWFLEKKG